jgi:drug/metabolite transporter (DMT)-like permease
MRTRRPFLGLALVVLGATLFIQNAGASRVALRAGVDPLTLTTIRVTRTFVVLLAVAAVVRRDALRPQGGHLGALIVVHGLVGVAALQWTYFVAIDRLPVAMALLLEPIGVSALGWAWFAESVDTVAVVGGVAVVVGMTVAQSAQRAPALAESPHLG